MAVRSTAEVVRAGHWRAVGGRRRVQDRRAGVCRRTPFLPERSVRRGALAFARADPALGDARTQFYVAYSYYRQGWGRLYHDDRLYAEGLAAIDRAIALAPAGRLVVDDPTLAMHSAEELKAELEAGMRIDAADFNPLRVFGTRK